MFFLRFFHLILIILLWALACFLQVWYLEPLVLSPFPPPGGPEIYGY
jgi:hypothetical protein